MSPKYDLWVKRIIAIIQIGGSYVAIIAIINLLSQPETNLYTSFISLILMTPLIILGFYSSILLFEKSKMGLRLSMIFQIIQIPYISLPYFMFNYRAGLNVITSLVGGKFIFLYNIGTYIDYAFFNAEKPFGFGINWIALFLFLYLYFDYKESKKVKNNSKIENINVSNV